MPTSTAPTALWNWSVEAPVAAPDVYRALAAVLDRPVLPLAGADPELLLDDVVLCDVWRRPGLFGMSVDCYRAPADVGETGVVAGFARLIGERCLLPDDTADPGRFLLITPEGVVRPVHLDVADTDDGEVLSNLRFCTASDPWCREWARCDQSRRAPDSVLPPYVVA
ncbi:hypothetical protein SAMN05444365_102454 [Micromonospora pattaloongensis]|uniref:Uncharacterized protein n=1 Tax=Micromonospora pattaloongensis TaxID=405436 RepID=A0A1H3KDD0_9ACTN|nr:hypothetical protein [Micromonospora pattaloongensis]SDY50103.1 hypothetical protein SAMN05444365_102454 [Micromonospora pattaloongensis]